MRRALLATLLLSIASSASSAEPGDGEPPSFECPAGTQLRTVERRYPNGAIVAALSPVGSQKWCVVPGTSREVRHGPYLVLDREGRWLESGEYEAVRRNGVPYRYRMAGVWRYRKPGICGDWITWQVSHSPEVRFPNKGTEPAGQVECGPLRKRRVTSRAQAISLRCLTLVDDTPDGPAWSWYEHGVPETEKRYVRGVLDGEFRSWYSNGQLRWQGAYREGREDGLWRHFECDGKPRCEGTAREGRIVGGWRCVAGPAPPLSGWLDSR